MPASEEHCQEVHFRFEPYSTGAFEGHRTLPPVFNRSIVQPAEGQNNRSHCSKYIHRFGHRVIQASLILQEAEGSAFSFPPGHPGETWAHGIFGIGRWKESGSKQAAKLKLCRHRDRVEIKMTFSVNVIPDSQCHCWSTTFYVSNSLYIYIFTIIYTCTRAIRFCFGLEEGADLTWCPLSLFACGDCAFAPCAKLTRLGYHTAGVYGPCHGRSTCLDSVYPRLDVTNTLCFV